MVEASLQDATFGQKVIDDMVGLANIDVNGMISYQDFELAMRRNFDGECNPQDM